MKLERIEINAAQTLRYRIEPIDSFAALAGSITTQVEAGPILAFIDAGLPASHLEDLSKHFDAARTGFNVRRVDPDESHKTLVNALQIAEALQAAGTRRRSTPPVVIGGGVACDVVGFACSLFRRGIPYIRVPTTLLGMVDVGVAAKTAVNHFGYRNRLGSYHPAFATFIFPGFLETLPRRHIVNGLAEIFKLALIKSRPLLELLDAHGHEFFKPALATHPATLEIITLAAQEMAEEIESNLWESSLRRVADYGHSFSPLIEMRHAGELLHGEAVAIDCLFSAILSQQRGLLTTGEVGRVFEIAHKLQLPRHHPAFTDLDLLTAALHDTTLHRDGHQNLPLMTGLGRATFVNDLSPAEIGTASRALSAMRAFPGAPAPRSPASGRAQPWRPS